MQMQEIRRWQKGEITTEQLNDFYKAQGIGGAIAGLAVGAVVAGPEVASAVLLWAARNPERIAQILAATEEAVGGQSGTITGAVGGASKAELRLAQKLAAEGKNVEVVAASGVGRTADFVVNGIKAEVKTLEGVKGVATSGTLKNAVAHGVGQSGNLIVDARGVKLSLADAQKGVSRAFGGDPRLKVIRVIGQGFDFTVARKN